MHAVASSGDASGRGWIAVIVSESQLGKDLNNDNHLDDNLLLVGERHAVLTSADAHAADSGVAALHQVPQPAPDQPQPTAQTAARVMQYGPLTRFLGDKPPAASSTAGRVGPNDRVLTVYNAATNKLWTVGVAENAQGGPRDPMIEDSGGTSFVSPAGRCVADGVVLASPSLCRPRVAGECPPGATCIDARVVVAVDLSTDEDGNGVPDSLE